MRPLFLMGHSRPLTWVTFNRDGDLLFTCGKGGQAAAVESDLQPGVGVTEDAEIVLLPKGGRPRTRADDVWMRVTYVNFEYLPDARLAVWNADNGERIGTYDVGKGVVWNCDCTLDSRRLVCASADQRVMIFDVLTGACLHDIQEAGPCKFVEWNRKPDEQNKFVLAHDSFGTQASKAIKVWQVDGPNGKPRRLWAQDDYSGRCVQVRWGPFDQTIISCHENGDIMIWNAETGEYINEFRAHKQFITCLSFSEDRLLMLSCCSDGTAKLWDTVDFNCIKNYQTDRPLNACDISPRFNKTGEERRCHILLGGGQAAEEVTTTASGEGKFEALLYHLVYQEELGSCKGHFGPLNTLSWRPDGGGYASGGEDGYVRIYHFDEEYFTDKFEP